MKQLIAVVPLVAILIMGCGGSATPTAPSTPAPAPSPDVSGRYSGTWTLQVLRLSDNFQTSFNCPATMTLTQPPGTNALGGFVVSSAPCEPVSFDLSGTVAPGGIVTLRTNGPRPPEGPCPEGMNVDYTGSIGSTGTRVLSARGATKVTCPEFGDHMFTYIMQLNKIG